MVRTIDILLTLIFLRAYGQDSSGCALPTYFSLCVAYGEEISLGTSPSFGYFCTFLLSLVYTFKGLYVKSCHFIIVADAAIRYLFLFIFFKLHRVRLWLDFSPSYLMAETSSYYWLCAYQVPDPSLGDLYPLAHLILTKTLETVFIIPNLPMKPWKQLKLYS